MHVFPIVEHYIEHKINIKALATKVPDAGKDYTKKALKKLGGSIGDTVGKVTKKLDLPPAYSKIADVGNTAGDASKKLDLPPAYSKIDDVTDDLADVGKKSNISDFLSKHGTKIIGGVTVATMVGVAVGLSEKINKTDYTITSIKKDSTDPSKTIITYTPEDMFTKRDSIMISSSNSDPNIDGEYSIQPIRGGSVKINKEISKQGNYGIMKCYTSVSNQTTQIINDITKPVTTTAAGITGGVITDVVGDIIPEVFKSMGLGGLGDIPVFSWIACVFCIIILSMLLMLVIVI